MLCCFNRGMKTDEKYREKSQMKETTIKVFPVEPECGLMEVEGVAAVLKSRWLITTSRCAQLKNFTELVGAKHALEDYM